MLRCSSFGITIEVEKIMLWNCIFPVIFRTCKKPDRRMRSYVLLAAAAVLALHELQAQVVVNEVCASNRTSHTDNYGDYEDWFELYNTTGAAVDIGGWWVSNRPGNPLKWQIPAGTMIPANGYRLIYCSKRDEGGAALHTDYQMNQYDEDVVMLSDAAGNLIDEFAFTPTNRTKLEHSRGRTTDGAATWSLFTTPTPGAANVGAANDYLAKPTLNPDGGFYAGAQNVTINGPAGATIRYTLDGTHPTAASPAYTGPIAINATTVLRAACFNGTNEPSYVETNTYFINENHTLPVVSIAGDGLLTLLGGSQIEPWGSLEYYGWNGELLDEAFGEFNEHGQDSWAYGQRGFDYITRDETGYKDALHYPIFRVSERDRYQRLIIKAAAGDNYDFGPGQPAHIRDQYVQALSQMGNLELDERSYEPAVLYVNGQYWGVYDVREKVDDHDFTRIYYGQDKYDLQMLKTWGGTWSEYGGAQAQTDWNTLRNFIMSNDMGDAGNFATVDAQFNWKSLVDYFCLNSYTVCSDWLNWNTGWWRGMNPDGEELKWRYILWDMDATFDHYANFTGIPNESADADPCQAENLGNPGGQGHTLILTKLIEENEMVHNYYVNRYTDLGNTVFSCEYMIPFLDSLIANIAPEMPRQIQRWGGSVAQWEANVQVLRDFIEDRCVLIQDGMVDCYDLVGPFDVCFNVEPPLSGTLEINSIAPEEYPFCGIYYGNIPTTLAPIPEEGWVFSHWEVYSTNDILPSPEDSLVTVDILAPDSIVAVFVPEVEYEVVFNVDPPLSGTIWIDGLIPATYPYIDTVNSNTVIEMAPIPEVDWIFSHWEIFNTNELLPSLTDSLVTIEIEGQDSIVAHFIPAISHELVFNVDPPMTGSISIDGSVPGLYPHTESFGETFIIDLAPLPAVDWAFSHWEVFSNEILPSLTDSAVTMEVLAEDSIVAHFVPARRYDIVLDMVPKDAGSITFDGVAYSAFPQTVTVYEGYDIPFSVSPKMYYDFLQWTLPNNAFTPDDSSAFALSAQFFQPDTLTAWLKPQEYVYYTPNAFTPNGDGINDLFHPLANVVDLDSYELNIYDRWGQVVFKSSDPFEGWDGSAGGNELPTGVYVFRAYVIDALKDDRYEIFGHVTLVR